jgi:Fis family transcriptional regulator
MLGRNEGSASTSLATQAAAPGASPQQDLTDVAKNNSQKNSLLPASKIKKPLCKHTEDALKQYFASLNGDRPGDLYDLVIGEVERPLFKAVMDFTDGNQSQAAGILGINRGTLRKKLKTYSLIH